METFKYEKNNEGKGITVCPYIVGGHVMIGSKFCQMCPNNYSFDKENQIVVCGDKDE